MFAQQSAEKDLGYSLGVGFEIDPSGSYLHQMLAKTFKSCMYQIRQGQVQRPNDYLFMAFKRLFLDYGRSQQSMGQAELSADLAELIHNPDILLE